MTTATHHKYFTASVAIMCITALDMFAIYKGIDGIAMTATITGIGTIVGFVFGKKMSLPAK